jgi:hypothetical protein
MRVRRALISILLLVAVAAGFALLHRRRTRNGELDRLRGERDRLRAELSAQVARDPVVGAPPPGQIAVGISSAFASDLVRTITTRLLDRVVLRLSGVRAHAQGDLETKVLFRRVKAGTWHLDLTFERIRAVLRPGEPEMDFGQGSDLVAVRFPVHVEEGTADAAIRFRWDSHRLANVVCRDFAVTERVSGAAVPSRYELKGAFRITADGEAITVLPEFEDRRLRVKVRPDEETWRRLRSALEAQDSFWRCGIAMNPEDVMGRLRGLTERGFDVGLPDVLFRDIRLPATLQRSLRFEGRDVQLQIVPRQLSLEPRMLWYGADVETRLSERSGEG